MWPDPTRKEGSGPMPTNINTPQIIGGVISRVWPRETSAEEVGSTNQPVKKTRTHLPPVCIRPSLSGVCTLSESNTTQDLDIHQQCAS